MPFELEGRRPPLVGRSVEQDGGRARAGEPAVAGHFLVELARAPSRHNRVRPAIATAPAPRRSRGARRWSPVIAHNLPLGPVT